MTNGGEVAEYPRYRLTRAGFDVISVFGALTATALPTAVIVEVLGDRGYQPSAVRNQLAKLVERGLPTKERRGRAAVFRRSGQLDQQYTKLSRGFPDSGFDGSFATLLHDIPERERSVRDRVLHVAHRYGDRTLRPGLLVGIDHAAAPALREALADLWDDSRWFLDTGLLRPADATRAVDWARKAFAVEALQSRAQELEALIDGFCRAPGTVSAYFDLYYQLVQELPTMPVLPPELAPTYDAPARMTTALERFNTLYGRVFAPGVFAGVVRSPEAGLIEFDDSGITRDLQRQITAASGSPAATDPVIIPDAADRR